jgi:RNA polymerase sigma-70 factor (ECF subfamily)
MKSQIDKKIILDAQNGSIYAFEKIVLKYEKPILAYIYRLVRKREDAEDLTQETFLKLYKNIKKYDHNNKFTTWLFAIAANTTCDWFRKQRRKKEVLILDDPKRLKEVEKFLLSNETQVHVKFDIMSGLKKIKPVYRSILSMFYFKGFSYKEIAEIKKMPINSVKTYLYRAKLALKEHLI